MNSAAATPSSVAPDRLGAALAERGYAVLGPDDFARFTGATLPELDALRPSWGSLPPDAHLRDGGRYRRRRHSCFVVDGRRARAWSRTARTGSRSNTTRCTAACERWFEPIEPAVLAPAGVAAHAARVRRRSRSALRGAQPWYVEAHQFRIDTTDGIGRPTPEGAHRDGVDFVAVVLVGREGIKGGETRVFEADGPDGQRFTMLEPWTTLLLDDARVIHESTPIQPLEALRPSRHPGPHVSRRRVPGAGRTGLIRRGAFIVDNTRRFSCGSPSASPSSC